MMNTKNVIWDIPELPGNKISSQDAHLAVLMDIRRELQILNKVLACPNAQAIPFKLDAILEAVRTTADNTTPKRRKRKKP